MIKINKLNKVYKNNKQALLDISLDIKKGSFIGILGPNGAGKSTLINILSGNVKKTSGEILIDSLDFDLAELETKKLLGVVPQELSFDPFFTVNEILSMQSGYFGIKNNQDYIDEILQNLDLYDKKNTTTRALSGGMKRRLLIAKALVHKPQLFILDEPTAGVDIELRHSLYKFLNQLHNQGTTIILTTHYLEEAELLCERIVIINHGKIIADDKTEQLIKRLGDNLEIQFHSEESKCRTIKDFVLKNAGIIDKNMIKIKIPRQKLPELFDKLKEKKINYTNFRVLEPKLEDIFIKLTSNK
jgi:ABC-2 type transport system ATP-binding protein